MATSYPFKPIVTDGMILYVDAANTKSYNGSNIWSDLTDYHDDGDLINTPVFSNVNGGSLLFNGIDTYIDFGDVLNMGTYSYTINTWIKLNSNGYQWFFSKGIANTQSYRYGIGCWFTNTLHAFIVGDAYDILVYGSTVLPINEWFMATCVFDRNADVSIYYNGVLETLTNASGQSSTISQWAGQNFQSNNPLRIASFTAGDNVSIYAVTDGDISISQVYNRVLTSNEILQNYDAQKNRFI